MVLSSNKHKNLFSFHLFETRQNADWDKPDESG